MSARSVTPRMATAARRSIVVPRPHHRTGQWTVFFALVLIAFFGLIYSRLSLDASAFELDELDEQIAVEEARQSELQVELARLQDPKRVAIEAERRGLIYPTARTGLSVQPVDERLIDVDARWVQAESRVRAQP